MKLMRVLLALVAVGGLTSLALLSREEAPTSVVMTDAAEKFLASLTEEQKKKAIFDFDDKHRVAWFFTPQQNNETKKYTRKGIPFEDLNEQQKKLALDLLRSGTSKSGFNQATTIMSLESILKAVEPPKKNAMIRNPEWYFVSVFGKPSKTGKWGWRFEGHHLSVNFTMDRGQVASVTPFLFGANPAEVKDGPKKGLRTLPEIEDLARDLIKSLSADQKQSAYQKDEALNEVAENTPAPSPGKQIGILGSNLTETQKETLLKLIKAYTDRMPDNIGAAEFNAAKQAGMDKVFFAYTGDPTPGKPYKYRVHGPSFLVEFLNVQADGSGNPANHIHSVWRHLPSDFGL
ncbi:MAG: DUF3500 domain-containing protein [Planctomycetes bacterium]|nr:DUF3500 domain-containing protein [Planctomycetota bacterium]